MLLQMRGTQTLALAQVLCAEAKQQKEAKLIEAVSTLTATAMTL